ncbi:MAG: branched-chain amino acid ABC transporter permease [Chloroflexi bacterium]|nr:branched-chain amino acid ABC transporter permease [Chloroflexota bacterium]
MPASTSGAPSTDELSDEPAATSARATGRRGMRIYTGFIGAVAVAIALVPVFGSNYTKTFVLQALMSCALAASWNLISGFTGYVSFGHSAFFGIGAYALPAPIAIIVAGISSATAGLLFGYPALRLRGPYFAVGMLGVAEAIRVGVTVAEPLTGGGKGLVLDPEDVLTVSYYAMFAVAIATVLVTYRVATLPVGLRLLAIREDEVAAELNGIQTTRLKIGAFAISALFAGLAGGIYAWQMSYIDPGTVFAGSLTVRAIAMTMLGGQGTVFGPVIGSVVLSGISEALWARFPFLHTALSGVLIIAIVLFLPGGITQILQDRGWLPRSRRL